MAKLTEKQEHYKNLRISGLEPIEAYKKAYNSKGNHNTISKEAHKLEQNPKIAPLLAEARREVADRVLVSVEDVVKGLLVEARDSGDGSSHGARVAAWKQLGEYTGGFDKNKQKVEQQVVEMSQEEWLSSLN